MLPAKLAEYAGGEELQAKEFAEAKDEIENRGGVLAAQVIINEVLVEALPELREGPKFEKCNPKAPRGKVSSDKRAKGLSSQRKGYG